MWSAGEGWGDVAREFAREGLEAGAVAFDVGDEFGGGVVFGVELGGSARFEVGPRAEKLLEAVEDVEEGWRHGEAGRGDAELGTEFEELGNAVAAGEVGGNVGLAAEVASEVKGAMEGVGWIVFEVEPLHVVVVGGIVGDDVHGGDGVWKQASEAAGGDGGEAEDGADDGKELKLGDGVTAKGGWDGEGEEEAVAPTAKAGGNGAFFGGVGGGPVATEVGGGVGGMWRGGGVVVEGEVTAGVGVERVDPGGGAGDADAAEGDGVFGVGRGARGGVAAGGVESGHGEAAAVDGAVDVFEEAHEFAVVAKQHWGW
jgi:hypothetical protein